MMFTADLAPQPVTRRVRLDLPHVDPDKLSRIAARLVLDLDLEEPRVFLATHAALLAGLASS